MMKKSETKVSVQIYCQAHQNRGFCGRIGPEGSEAKAKMEGWGNRRDLASTYVLHPFISTLSPISERQRTEGDQRGSEEQRVAKSIFELRSNYSIQAL
jgi:hypothetical protein